MRWDTIIRAQCNPAETANSPIVCPTTDPPPGLLCSDLDECCSDPAFRQQYPDLCSGREILTLKIKPEFVTVGTLQTVQYSTILVNVTTGTEVELTSGLVYRVSDPTIGIIGGGSGNLTTLAEGIATVSVTWQNLSASAQVQVIGDGLSGCDETNIGMLILLDNSKSMTSLFSSNTKISYAKLLGKRFAEEVNHTKDKVGLMTVNSAATLIEALTDDVQTVAASVMAVGSTTQRTDLATGLREAITHLNAQSGLTKKVIVLLSDGQNTVGDDPIPLAQDFKAAGGLIIAVGVRSAGSAFGRLQQIASAGFFLNATVQTETETGNLLSGLKGYFCAGNCAPARPTCGGRPELNYLTLQNWDLEGLVDLIGEGIVATMFDFLPGNGMYLDMVGSGAPWKGKLTSKQAFTLANGVQYKFSYYLAGNQRIDAPGHQIRAQVGTLGSAEHTVDDWLAPFTEYSQTVTGDGGDHKLIIEQSSYAVDAYGTLLDRVKLERLDNGEVLLFDTFDNENEVCIPPPCGGFVSPSGATYYGYYCYGVGCLTEPVPEQKEDPNPPPDVEGDQPPQGWTSYQCYTASCPSGSAGGSVTACEEATSEISQADADAKATAAAKASAEDQLVCLYTFAVGDLVNIHILHPECQLPGGESPKKGFGAVGVTAEDYWNAYSLFMGTAGAFNHEKEKLDWERFWLTGGSFQDMDISHADQMFKCGQSGGIDEFHTVPALFPAETMWVDCIRPKQAGTYELYLFGHGPLSANTGKFNVRVGTITSGVLQAGYTDYGNKETLNSMAFEDPGLMENKHYVKFTGIVVSNVNQFIIITRLKGASNDSSFVQGYQIKRTA